MAFVALFQGTAATEHVDAVRQSVEKLARDSRNEPGAIRYEFYQQEDDLAVFMLFAIWESEADWRAHVAGDAHRRHEARLPEGAWASRPVMTRLRSLSEIT